MEKLQEIKENAHHFKEYEFFTTLHYEDYLWLIEQAEKLNTIAKAWVRIETSETESTSDFYNEVQDILSEID